MVVFKYTLKDTAEKQRMRMPVGARLLHVDAQENVLCLWALVPGDGDNAFIEDRVFIIVGTGDPAIQASWTYIGTVLMYGGESVWHIFEIEP